MICGSKYVSLETQRTWCNYTCHLQNTRSISGSSKKTKQCNSTDFNSSFRRMSIHIMLCKLQWYNIKPLTTCYNMGLVYFMKLYICINLPTSDSAWNKCCRLCTFISLLSKLSMFCGALNIYGLCSNSTLIILHRYHLNISLQCSVWVRLSKMCLTFANHWTISSMISTSTNSTNSTEAIKFN